MQVTITTLIYFHYYFNFHPHLPLSLYLPSVFEQVFLKRSKFFFLIQHINSTHLVPSSSSSVSVFPASSHLHIIIEVESILRLHKSVCVCSCVATLLSWSLCATLPHSVCKLDGSWTSDARRPIEAKFRRRQRALLRLLQADQ